MNPNGTNLIDQLLNNAIQSSTRVNSNLDNLFLQEELDKKVYGNVNEGRYGKEFPINMNDYANLASRANIPNAISNLDSYITDSGSSGKTLNDLTEGLISRMRLGDSPGGIIAYRSPVNFKDRGSYTYAREPLNAPDTIRIFRTPSGTYKTYKDSDMQVETLMHELLHGIKLPPQTMGVDRSGNKVMLERDYLRHMDRSGFTQNDFNFYEQKMIESLGDSYWSKKQGIKEARKLLHPPMNTKDDPTKHQRYINMVFGNSLLDDLLNKGNYVK